jgi:hypothetical protein
LRKASVATQRIDQRLAEHAAPDGIDAVTDVLHRRHSDRTRVYLKLVGRNNAVYCAASGIAIATLMRNALKIAPEGSRRMTPLSLWRNSPVM